jgi:predicted RND superfamily exporter protein
MNDLEKNGNQDTPNPVDGIEQIPENSKKVHTMLENLEMMTLQRTSKNNLDIKVLDKEQKDKLLSIVEKNEDHAYAYSIRRLDIQEKLNTKALDASIFNQKTLRYLALGGFLVAAIILVLILFFKENYFIPYLTFITGLFGGVGLKSLFVKPSNNSSSVSENNKEEKDEDEKEES